MSAEKTSKPKSKDSESIIRPLTSLNNLAKIYEPDSDNRNGLEQLDTTHQYIPIIGDGHCMYRSIITGMLLQLAKLPAPTREAFESSLIQKIEEIGGSVELFSGLQTLTNAIERFSGPKLPKIEDIIGDRKISDGLVKFCRHLAADWNNFFGNEVFENEARLYSGSTKKYLAEQVDMNIPEMGGNPELTALSNVFDMDLIVLNVVQIGKGAHKVAQRQNFENPNSLFEVDLLFRPGHYDLAVRKS